MVKLKFLLLPLWLLVSTSIQAQRLQILFTNDLHGAVEQYNNDINRGGYARVKYILDKYTQQAAEEGIETIRLDGGDFLEGNLSYLAKNSRSLVEIHNAMNFDATVIGNHDYLMGTKGLAQLLESTSPIKNFLAANVHFKWGYQKLNKYFRPYTILKRAGLKIGVIGVTTNEKIYTFRIPHAKVKKPIKVVNKFAKKINEKVDLTIALTHLGYTTDKELAEKSSQVDIIVGSHSHTTLKEATYIKNEEGHSIPIVQGGSETRYVGRIILDITGKHQSRIVKYELINTRGFEKDIQVEELAEKIDQQLEDEYGKDWLYEQIAYSSLDPNDYRTGRQQWGSFIADTLRLKLKTDIGLHASEFAGSRYPVGSVNRKEVFNSYPRVFDLKKRRGWKIYTMNVYGFLLKPIIKVVYNNNMGVYLSGVKIKYKKKKDGTLKVKKIYINGRKIRPWKKYSIAVPEGIVLGSIGVSRILTALYARQIRESHDYVWDALNERLQNSIDINADFTKNSNIDFTILEK